MSQGRCVRGGGVAHKCVCVCVFEMAWRCTISSNATRARMPTPDSSFSDLVAPNGEDDACGRPV